MGNRWMTGLLLLCLAAGWASAGNAAPRTIDAVTSGTSHRDLYGMAMTADGQDGLAIGDRGTLLSTTDGGKSWTRSQMDTELALFDAALAGERRVLVGQMGLVRYSDDGGETWSEAEVDTEERLLGVSMNADGLTVAVGSFGTIATSRDGGETWTLSDFSVADVVPDSYNAHLNDVHVSADGTVVIVGEFSLVLRSTDGGASFERVHMGDVALFGLHLRDDGVGYAVGQSGTVLRTTDGGSTWQALDTGIEANLLGVHAAADGTVTVPGMRHMIVSEDGGESWTQVHAGDADRNWYAAVVGTSAGVYAAGHTGRVIRIDKQSGG